MLRIYLRRNFAFSQGEIAQLQRLAALRLAALEIVSDNAMQEWDVFTCDRLEMPGTEVKMTVAVW